MLVVLRGSSAEAQRITQTKRAMSNTRLSVLLSGAIGVAILSGLPSARSADVDLKGVLKTMRAELEAIDEGLSYTLKVFEQDSTEPRSVLIWSEDGRKFKYHNSEFNSRGELAFSSEMSFNGVQSLDALQKSGVVYAKKGVPDLPQEVLNKAHIFSFLSFLGGATEEGGASSGLLSQTLGAEWNKAIKNARVVDSKKTNEEFDFRMDFDGYSRELAVPVTYRVAFKFWDKTLIPVSWEMLDSQSRRLVRFSVERFSANNAKGLLLPERVRIDYFAISADNVYEKPTNWQYIDYENVAFDVPDPIDLDVTAADVVYDIDTDTSISIPR